MKRFKRAVVAAMVVGVTVLGITGTVAQAATKVEGCVSVGPVGDCTYTAHDYGSLVGFGVWKATIVRGDEVIDVSSVGIIDSKDLHNVIHPGDRVHVRTFFCICCPWLPSVVTVGNTVT